MRSPKIFVLTCPDLTTKINIGFCDSQTLISPFWAWYAQCSSYRRIICSRSNYLEHILVVAIGGWFDLEFAKGGFSDASCSNYRSILSSCSYYIEDFYYRSILIDNGDIVHWSMGDFPSHHQHHHLVWFVVSICQCSSASFRFCATQL